MSTTSIPPLSTVDSAASSSTALSDAESSELTEAVAALKVGRATPPPKRPSIDVIRVGNNGQVDSGYASHSGSQTSTPGVSTFIDGGTVVGKAPRWSIAGRKKMKLLHFEKDIPRLTQNRFEDLRELHADNLIKLTRGLSRCRGILMSLKVLGENEATAAPWVFIQCDKAIAGKVRRFFRQPFVESDFKPAHPNSHTPSFEVYVYEMPPLALGSNSQCPPTARPDCHRAGELPELYFKERTSMSLCGSKIIVSSSGQRRSATIGGLVSIQWKSGDYQLLGLTASHFLAQEQHLEDLEEEEHTDDDPDEGPFEDGQEFELDLGSLQNEAPAIPAENAAQHEMSENLGAVFGHIFKTSLDSLQDGPNLDWALFTIENKSLLSPNCVTPHEITRVAHPDQKETQQAVLLSTATSGLVPGTLSSSWSYLMLAPGKSLVRTNALKVRDHPALMSGDSGAWVVDYLTGELYGHLVASDVFGVAYVIPINDIFQDIQRRLSLEGVKLPAGHDSLVGKANDVVKVPVRKKFLGYEDELEAPVGVLPKNAPLDAEKKATLTKMLGVHELLTNPRNSDSGPPKAKLQLELAREITRIRELEEQQTEWKREKDLMETRRAQTFLFGHTADVYSQLPPDFVGHTTHPVRSVAKYHGPTEPRQERGPGPSSTTPIQTDTQQVLDRHLLIFGYIGQAFQALQTMISNSSNPQNTFLVLMLAIFTITLIIIFVIYRIITTKLMFQGIIVVLAFLFAVTHSFSILKHAEIEKRKIEVEKEKVEVFGRECRRLIGQPLPVTMGRVEELTD